MCCNPPERLKSKSPIGNLWLILKFGWARDQSDGYLDKSIVSPEIRRAKATEGKMRRNMDLARKILLELEGRPFTVAPHRIGIDGYTAEEISYHVQLLRQASFIDAVDLTNQSLRSPDWLPTTITWNGHEFLESSRDETRWEKTKNVLREKGGPMTLEALKIIMSELIHRSLSSI